MSNDSGMLCLIFLTSFTFGCLDLAILLIILRCILNKKLEESEKRIAEKEQNMLMRFLIIIGIISLLAMCSAQDDEFVQVIDPYVEEEEDPPIELIPDGDKPVVFPEQMARAANMIADIFIGNESDHNLFLSDTYWPVQIGNNTTLNLSA